MQGYFTHIEEETLKNTDYRRVLYTARYSQLVLMSLKPGEEIGEEMHGLDQFIRFEQGSATVVLDKTDKRTICAEDAVIVPAGTWHNVINTGEEDVKLYTVYSPPEHKDGTVHPTKADEQEEHFNGHTTE